MAHNYIYTNYIMIQEVKIAKASHFTLHEQKITAFTNHGNQYPLPLFERGVKLFSRCSSKLT